MAVIVAGEPLVTPDDVAVTLGRPTPVDPQSATYGQWSVWISDAELLIQSRLGDLAVLDQNILAYVVREAVALKVKNPDPAIQTTTSVDDGSVSKRYEKAGGQITILDEWWAMLTSSEDDDAPEAAFTINTRPAPRRCW